MQPSLRRAAPATPLADLARRFNVQHSTSNQGELRVTPKLFGSASRHVNTSGHGTHQGSQALQGKRKEHRWAAFKELEAAFRKSLAERQPRLEPSERDAIVAAKLAGIRDAVVTVAFLRSLVASEVQNFTDLRRGVRSDAKGAGGSRARVNADGATSPHSVPAVVVAQADGSRRPGLQRSDFEEAAAFQTRTPLSAAGSSGVPASVHVHLATPPKGAAALKPTRQELVAAYTLRFASHFGQYKGIPGEHMDETHARKRAELARLVAKMEGTRWIQLPQEGLPQDNRFQSAVFHVANGSSADEACGRVFPSLK